MHLSNLKQKQNKQNSMPFSLQILNLFHQPQRVLSLDFFVKRRKETKNQKIKPSHYNQ